MTRGQVGELFGLDDAPIPKSARKKRSKKQDANDEFDFQCRARDLPDFERELMFAKATHGRKWRFDFAFLEYKLAVEIEGIVVTTAYVGGQVKEISIDRQAAIAIIGGQKRLVSMGRHAHADGFREDCVKYATAAELGWTVIRFDPKMIRDNRAIQHTMRCLMSRGWKNPGDPR